MAVLLLSPFVSAKSLVRGCVHPQVLIRGPDQCHCWLWRFRRHGFLMSLHDEPEPVCSAGAGVRVLRLRTSDDETTPCMDRVQAHFCLTGHRRLSGMECVNESHECPLSLCRVTFLRAQRASFFQTIPQPTRCMSHVLQHVERHEDELDWNSTSV